MAPRITDSLRAQLDSLPTTPGVYLMKDKEDRVIYVGKAVNLRSRARSYFQAAAQHNAKTRRLQEEITSLEWIIVPSEVDALILENTLIKRYQPRFNTMLKDDKTYPFIKVHWQDDFPKVTITRRVQRDGAGYHGPYPSAFAVRQTLDNLRRIFPYLTCNREITGQDQRACLYYDIKLCAAPCIGVVDRTEYREIMQGMADFLSGESDEAIAALENRMRRAAQALQFERAAMYRDQIELAKRLVARQQVVYPTRVDQDVIGLGRDDGGDETAVQVFFVRRGKVVGRDGFILARTADDDPAELLASFLGQFYDQATSVPPQVLLPQLPDDAAVFEEWLSNKQGQPVALIEPDEGEADDLMDLVTANALEALRTQRAVRQADKSKQVLALQELQEALGLDGPPSRIECYDISTLQGTHTVGSMVVFAEGTPRKSDYRRFKVRGRGAQGEPDDYAAMRDVLRRRFRRAVEPQDGDPGARARQRAAAWTLLPNLVIVDGGKGQLGVAVEVLREYDLLDEVAVAALAKQREELFLPEQARSIILARGSEGLYLVQRIRDEAHRFAVTYHRKLRREAGITSELNRVPGIGPKRRQALLEAFGSLDMIRAADLDGLAAVPGMTRKAAEAIKEHL